MSKVMLRPNLKSQMRKLKHTTAFDLYEFSPSLLKPFAVPMEKNSVSRRIRCVMEFVVGYKVYYIRVDEVWAGYCIVSNGRNPRYPFCTGSDIVYGRYFVLPEFRGRGLASAMVYEILNGINLQYDKAYAYVHANNTASHATIRKLGGIETAHFRKIGKLRRIKMDENGEYTVYCHMH